MSAVDTVNRVLRWAIAGEGPPPLGDLNLPGALIRPPEETRNLLAQLLTKEAAILRLDTPALKDSEDSAVSPDPALIALAIGVMTMPGAAERLLAGLPAAATPPDLLLRHGLAGPALQYCPESLSDLFRQASPLTGLLDFPAPGDRDRILALIDLFLPLNQWRRAVVLGLARPTDSAKVRDWRAGIMARLRTGREEQRRFVLDVYESQLVLHRAEIIEQTGRARAAILDPLRHKDEERLRDSLSLARWWTPLRDLERARLNEIRRRPYLHYDYRQGVKLANLAQTLIGECS